MQSVSIYGLDLSTFPHLYHYPLSLSHHFRSYLDCLGSLLTVSHIGPLVCSQHRDHCYPFKTSVLSTQNCGSCLIQRKGQTPEAPVIWPSSHPHTRSPSPVYLSSHMPFWCFLHVGPAGFYLSLSPDCSLYLEILPLGILLACFLKNFRSLLACYIPWVALLGPSVNSRPFNCCCVPSPALLFSITVKTTCH